jgi:hypothetical protein
MQSRLRLKMLRQPDDFTCGPTCLHALYDYYDDEMPLQRVIDEVPTVDGGGTLASILACHAMRRGYQATIYTYDVNLFDPTWFRLSRAELRLRLEAQALAKPSPKLRQATKAYIEYLDLGGQLYLEDLTSALIRRHLRRGRPVLAGLSATYLYRCAREHAHGDYDDIKGEPMGHFILLAGYNARERTVLVVDPQCPNPFGDRHTYVVPLNRLICAILLGIVTFDAKLLIIEPPSDSAEEPHAPRYRDGLLLETTL